MNQTLVITLLWGVKLLCRMSKDWALPVAFSSWGRGGGPVAISATRGRIGSRNGSSGLGFLEELNEVSSRGGQSVRAMTAWDTRIEL